MLDFTGFITKATQEIKEIVDMAKMWRVKGFKIGILENSRASSTTLEELAEDNWMEMNTSKHQCQIMQKKM